MTFPNPLTELADRVQALTSACREVDALIAEAIMPSAAHRHAIINDIGLQAYTGSFDAAMLLLPQDTLWTMDSWSSDRWAVGIWKPSTGRWLIYSSKAKTGRTPTLALASAALHSRVRARAASEPSHG